MECWREWYWEDDADSGEGVMTNCGQKKREQELFVVLLPNHNLEQILEVRWWEGYCIVMG